MSVLASFFHRFGVDFGVHLGALWRPSGGNKGEIGCPKANSETT